MYFLVKTVNISEEQKVRKFLRSLWLTSAFNLSTYSFEMFSFRGSINLTEESITGKVPWLAQIIQHAITVDKSCVLIFALVRHIWCGYYWPLLAVMVDIAGEISYRE